MISLYFFQWFDKFSFMVSRLIYTNALAVGVIFILIRTSRVYNSRSWSGFQNPFSILLALYLSLKSPSILTMSVLLMGVWFVDLNRSFVIFTFLFFTNSVLMNIHTPWIYSLFIVLWMTLGVSSSLFGLGLSEISERNACRISLALSLYNNYSNWRFLQWSNASSNVHERGPLYSEWSWIFIWVRFILWSFLAFSAIFRGFPVFPSRSKIYLSHSGCLHIFSENFIASSLS